MIVKAWFFFVDISAPSRWLQGFSGGLGSRNRRPQTLIEVLYGHQPFDAPGKIPWLPNPYCTCGKYMLLQDVKKFTQRTTLDLVTSTVCKREEAQVLRKEHFILQKPYILHSLYWSTPFYFTQCRPWLASTNKSAKLGMWHAWRWSSLLWHRLACELFH